MWFWSLLEVLLAMAVVVFIATQVILPIFQGTPTFPLFALKKEDEKLTEAAGAIQKEKVHMEIEKLTHELDEMHKRHNIPNATPKEGNGNGNVNAS